MSLQVWLTLKLLKCFDTQNIAKCAFIAIREKIKETTCKTCPQQEGCDNLDMDVSHEIFKMLAEGVPAYANVLSQWGVLSGDSQKTIMIMPALGSSMYPEIEQGDLLVLSKVIPKKGDIVSVALDSNSSAMHRIVKTEKHHITTKGDNNLKEDNRVNRMRQVATVIKVIKKDDSCYGPLSKLLHTQRT